MKYEANEMTNEKPNQYNICTAHNFMKYSICYERCEQMSV